MICGSQEKIYSNSTSNHITLESGANAELFNFFGQNVIEILSDSNGFTVSKSGTIVTFKGADGTLLKLPATQTVQLINFIDRPSLTLGIYNGQVMLDDQVVTATPHQLNDNLQYHNDENTPDLPFFVGVNSLNKSLYLDVKKKNLAPLLFFLLLKV